MFNKWRSVHSIEDFLRFIEDESDSSSTNRLFRGQSKDYPLIPRIGRKQSSKSNVELESNLMSEFRRRLADTPNFSKMEEWDLLFYAQHYGLATRLLDWSSNPLIAIWFACKDLKNSSSDDGFIYVLESCEHENTVPKSPFTIEKTTVVKPNLNNPRIAAQNGWFTAHANYSDDGGYICLTEDSHVNYKIYCVGINGLSSEKILEQLDLFGINEHTVYLGVEGLARYLNWVHRGDL